MNELTTIYTFLDKIGIGYQEERLEEITFLPGVKISRGRLLIDQDKLRYPGDVLHEAGHIALTPPKERQQLSGNITEGHPEKEGEEIGVLLWTYLAASEMELDTKVVFHDGGYKGEAEWINQNFERGEYIGLPLLQWMNMVSIEANTTPPKVINWLRP